MGTGFADNHRSLRSLAGIGLGALASLAQTGDPEVTAHGFDGDRGNPID